jgi:beta-lactamase regulating signal transducer with metallopeptidase domain
MTPPAMELAAQIAVESVLNSLPEGLLVAASAWTLLRVMGRQNAGTRFAVWMVALVSIATLPWLRGLDAAGAGSSTGTALAIPAAWAIAFFFIWMLASGALLARLAVGVWQMRRMRRSCREIDLENLPPLLQEPIRQTKRRVRILVSAEARVPAAVGLWKPSIVLPAWTLDELSPDDLRAIAVHEITHLQRRDDWTNLLQKAVRAILFFHPAVWWIESRLSMEREMACDDAVLAATGNPHAYAGCLIGLLERSCARRGWTVAQAAVARAHDAAQRIAQILHPRRSATTRVGRVALAAAATFSTACLAVTACVPQFVAVTHGQPFAEVAAASTQPSDLSPDRTPARVIPAAFAVPEPEKTYPRHAVKPTRARTVTAALLIRKKPAAPRVELASLRDPSPLPAQKEAAPQWTVYETAFYTRTADEQAPTGLPAMVETLTVQTVSYAGSGMAVQRTSVVQVVWMIPVEVVARAEASSKSI